MKNSPANPDCPQATSAILSLKQHYAMELLLIGKTDAEVAALISVDSDIVGQWQNKDSAFILAINALRAAAWEGSVARLKSLMSRALDVVEEAVTRDEMVAISFLQGIGRENSRSASPRPTGEVDVTRQEVKSTGQAPTVRTEKLVRKMSLLDVCRL